MASATMRLKWWLQDQLSCNKQDLFLILAFLSCAFIFIYGFILKYDSPDVTDIRGDLGADEELIKKALKDAGGDEQWLLEPKLYDREEERNKFQRVQEKLKQLKERKPAEKKVKDKVVMEDESKLALKAEEVNENIKKDNEYWLKKYRHVFHKGFELDVPPDFNLKGGRAHCTIYDHTKTVNETYDCIKLKVDPKPYICLYPTASDIHVSNYIRAEGVWEPHIVKLFVEYLNMDPQLGFIDIGANIGAYTLISAALGHRTVAIEPYIENLKHLSQGIQRSKLQDNVLVLQNAVSDKRLAYVDLRLDPTNQGGIYVDESNHNFRCYGDHCPPQAKTIFMDDILEVVNFKSAVIKIDIEGHEHRAFRHSKELFDRLYVPCIFMEWIKLKSYYGTELDESEDKTMVHELVEYLTEQGYQAFSMVTYQKLTPGYWYAWPDDVIWKHRLVEAKIT